MTARLLYVLSPAKTLDMTRTAVRCCTDPALLSDAQALVEQLRELSQMQLKSLLGVSDALAKLNRQRFQSFDVKVERHEPTPSDHKKQAVLAFNGPAYQDKELGYAQDHLRILCGLYGILRPLDLIQAYRLEMGQKFANTRGKDLYAFWGSTLAEAINRHFEDAGNDAKVLVNLASQEYFKSIQVDALDPGIQVVECVFQDDGKVKSVYAKRARGLMCRFLIQNRVESVAGIKAFNFEGYVFAAKASSETTLVFNRTAAKQKEVLKEIQAKAKLAKAAAATAADPASTMPAIGENVKAEVESVEADAGSAAKQPTQASGRKKRRTA
ncbi:hypothetical protein PybrP1_002098 [[Pythium] brassicae (nom. inval.)]|nr:hypothetical protein PybrP1_002098 [[Pythium] brassicae (nom. inval.)]